MEKVGASWGRGTSEEFQSGMWERVVSGDEGRCWDSEPPRPLQAALGPAPLKQETAEPLSAGSLTRFAPRVCL